MLDWPILDGVDVMDARASVLLPKPAPMARAGIQAKDSQGLIYA
jgi:hypothetical protein